MPSSTTDLLDAIVEPLRHPDASHMDRRRAVEIVVAALDQTSGRAGPGGPPTAYSLLARHGLGALWLDAVTRLGLEALVSVGHSDTMASSS